MHVYMDADRPDWLAHGMCKALWLGEPSRRKEAAGSEAKAFTSFEERECLASLLSTYARLRSDGKVKAEPALERLLRIVEDGLADGFVLYELGSRISPHATLLAGPEAQEQLRRYVGKYVLTRQAP